MTDRIDIEALKNPKLSTTEAIDQRAIEKDDKREKQERTDVVKQYLSQITKKKIESSIRASLKNGNTIRHVIVQVGANRLSVDIDRNVLVKTPLVELDLYLDQLSDVHSNDSIMNIIERYVPIGYEAYASYGYTRSYGVFNLHQIEIIDTKAPYACIIL